MSMHKLPLSRLEEEGLKAHGLSIETPSQLSDAFKQGIAWALSQQADPQPQRSVPEGYVLLPKQCPSWLEDVYDWSCREHGMLLTLYLPAYDAMVKALEEDQKLSTKG